MMKIPLLASCVLAAVLAASPVLAQTDSPEKKPEAAATASPSPAPSTLAASSATPLPSRQVAEFFRLLTEGRVDAAYEQLMKGTKIAEIPRDVEMLKAKTREAIRAFGEINGYELVEEKKVGSDGLHLRCLTCISLGKQLPIRWRFYYYNMGTTFDGPWKLIDIRIDDRLMDLFGEPAPTAENTPLPQRRRVQKPNE